LSGSDRLGVFGVLREVWALREVVEARLVIVAAILGVVPFLAVDAVFATVRESGALLGLFGTEVTFRAVAVALLFAVLLTVELVASMRSFEPVAVAILGGGTVSLVPSMIAGLVTSLFTLSTTVGG